MGIGFTSRALKDCGDRYGLRPVKRGSRYGATSQTIAISRSLIGCAGKRAVIRLRPWQPVTSMSPVVKRDSRQSHGSVLEGPDARRGDRGNTPNDRAADSQMRVMEAEIGRAHV